MATFPSKHIKTRHINGAEINHGPLVNGRINGIKVLGHKEALIMLRVQLVPGKVKFFESAERLRVRINDHSEVSVYVVHSKDLPHAYHALRNKRCGYVTRQRLLSDEGGTATWHSLTGVPLDEDEIRMSRVSHKTLPQKKSLLKRIWEWLDTPPKLFVKKATEEEDNSIDRALDYLERAFQTKTTK